MTVLAVCAATTISLAQVQSLNVVGYNTAIVHGWSMQSVAFSGIGGGGFNPNVNLSATNLTAGDEIFFWTGTGYQPVFFGDIYDETFENVLGQGWLDPETGYTAWQGTTNVAVGFWLNTQNSIPVTFSGQVPAAGTNLITLKQGWNLIGAGFPIDVILNNATWTGVTSGDQVFGWNGTGYIPVMYGDIYDETFENILGQGWLDPDTGYTAMTTPLSGSSSGFWVSLANPSGGSVRFALNY